MQPAWRTAVAALVMHGAACSAACADGVVASWVQLAPGSTSPAPTLAEFGDAPLSATNTVLLRAIVADIASGCPAATLDRATPLALQPRFAPASLAGTALYPAAGPVPGTPGSTNGKPGYPQYFINAAATAASTLPGPGGTTVPMAWAGSNAGWTECEAIVPPGHGVASIGGVDLSLPVAHPKRILVMADTGCRMNGARTASGANQQNCQDSAAFPLHFLAAYEASFKPDLIVHVGDWFYRDTNCHDTFAGCDAPASASYETWGDTFDSWNADVFFPAKTLLAAAPLVMLRGNHESCGRGARGWFALLDPHPYDPAKVKCSATAHYPGPLTPPTTTTRGTPAYTADFTPTYRVPVNGVTLLVHDSSFASDVRVDLAMAQNDDIDLSNALAALGDDATSIFVTHRPTLGLTNPNAAVPPATAPAIYPGDTVPDDNGNATLQAVFSSGTSAYSAFVAGVPAGIGLLLSGHVHQLQYLVPESLLAPQLIVGVGGSLLDADMNTGTVPDGHTDVAAYTQVSGPGAAWRFIVATLPPPYTAPATATVGIARAYAHDEFGFAVLDAVTDGSGRTTGFTASLYTIAARQTGRCAITLGNAAGQARGIACDF